MSILFIIQEIIIFMTSCKLVLGIYKGLHLACIMQTYGCPLLYGTFLATQLLSSSYVAGAIALIAVNRIYDLIGHARAALQ